MSRRLFTARTRIPIPEPYGKMANPRELRDQMVETLRVWIAAGKPKAADKLPRSPKGDIIRKVRVASKDKVAIELHGGTVNRGDMARVDVFRKAGKKGKWEYYVVPIYPHQIGTMDRPPNRAVKGAAATRPNGMCLTVPLSIYGRSIRTRALRLPSPMVK